MAVSQESAMLHKLHSKCRDAVLLAIVSLNAFLSAGLLRNVAKASQPALSSLDFNVLTHVPSFGEARGCLLQRLVVIRSP